MKLIMAVCLLGLTTAGSTTVKSRRKAPDAARPRSVKTVMPEAERFVRYDGLILKHAQTHRLNPRLVKSIIAAESRFHYNAVSPVGARGLMQLMPVTAEGLGVHRSQLHDPDSNLRAGTSYLEVLCGRARIIYALKGAGCRNAPLWVQQRVVAAYHGGPRMFHRNPENWPPSTQHYVREVFRYFGSPQTALTRPAIKTTPKRARYMLARVG